MTRTQILNSKESYLLYKELLGNKIKAAKEIALASKNRRVQCFKKLSEVAPEINTYCSHSLADIIKGDTKDIDFNCTGFIKSRLKLIVNNFIEAKKQHEIDLAILKDLLDLIVDEYQFRFIIKEYNKLAGDQMIKSGFKIPIGNMGYIILRKKKISPRIRTSDSKEIYRVNWDETLKTRDRLLAAGEAIRTKNNPNGKPYMIFFNEGYNVWLHWTKSIATIKSKSLFYFKPTIGEHGIVNKLQQYRKHNPTVDGLYDHYEKTKLRHE